MVDLGISRTQDIQNPLSANPPATRISPEEQDRAARPPALKAARKVPAGASRTEAPVDLDGEVRRLNDLLGGTTRIQFVINRSTNDVYVEVVDKESNKVLKTIPPSEVSAVAAKLSEGGIVVDSKS